MSFPNRFRARRFSRLESLESRTLLAADVSVALVGDTLEIEGDDSGFIIALAQAEAQTFQVDVLLASDESELFSGELSGVNNINIRTGAGNDLVDIVFEAIGGDVEIRTGGGDDLIGLSGVDLSSGGQNTIAGDVNIATGAGTSEVLLESVDVLDDLRILGGSEMDVVSLNDVSVADDSLISLLGGGDQVSIDNTGSVDGGDSDITRSFGDSLTIFTGGGDDTIAIFNANVGKLAILTGGQDDTVSLNGIHVAGKSLISTASGEDDVAIRQSAARDSLFEGTVIVNLGSGDDTLAIENTDFESHVLLFGGSGTDDLDLTSVTIDGLFFENLET